VTSADVLATYDRLRKTQRAINNRIIKTLSRKAIEESAKSLGFYENGQLVADDDSDLDLVMDSAIYDYFPSGGKNAVARFASNTNLDGDNKAVVDAMLRARFTLVELGESVEGVGVQANDLVFSERFFLADVALSQTIVVGVVLATRLLTFDSFSMTTGAHIVIDESLAALVGRGWSRLAGRARDLAPRDSSALARLWLKLGMMDPDDARIVLADMAAGQLPIDDPRRETYSRLRLERSRRW
jgi:hypothetical protein